MASTALLRLNAFRWRYDDGGETDATWYAPLNGNLPAPAQAGGRLRLRFAILEYAGKNARNSAFTIIARVNGGTWQEAGTPNCAIDRFDSGYIVGSVPTTQQISSEPFIPGYLKDVNSVPPAVTINSNSVSEWESALELPMEKYGSIYNDNDTVEIAMAYDDLTVLDDYAQMPVFTVDPLSNFSMFYLGDQRQLDIYLGDTPARHIYLGETEVYRNT